MNLLNTVYTYTCWDLFSCSLGDHNLTRKSYITLVSVLTSKTSCLRELNLAQSNISDLDLKLLCAGLQNPQCRLETLK